MYCVVDGRLRAASEPQILPIDRGFTLGDGVFETMFARGQQIFRLGDHLARLRSGADTISMSLDVDDARLQADLQRALEANALPEAVVRLTISRGSAVRGLLPDGNAPPTVAIQVSPRRPPPAEKLAAGFSAVASAIRRNDTSPLSRIKSCSYLDNVLARMAAAALGADEALLLNTRGRLVCCSAANVHVVRGGCVLTPPIEAGALPGITRKVVRELCASLGIAWREDDLDLDAIAAADEAFITNSVLGVTPLTTAQGRPVGAGLPGPTSRRLASAYRQLLLST